MNSVNHATLELVKHFEGLYLNAYLCPSGIPTIGYGHTKGVELGQKTTEAKANAWLEEDMLDAATAVDKLVKVNLNQNQRGALASFTFNLGSGQLKGSTLLSLVNDGKLQEAAGEFEKWVYGTDPETGKKIKLNGLIYRRQKEKELFLTPVVSDSSETEAKTEVPVSTLSADPAPEVFPETPPENLHVR